LKNQLVVQLFKSAGIPKDYKTCRASGEFICLFIIYLREGQDASVKLPLNIAPPLTLFILSPFAVLPGRL
jgi:hypothetical protein